MLISSIVIADKASSQITQSAWGSNLSLQSPSVVQLPVSPQQVASVSRNGRSLVITLKSGETLTIGNFFPADAQAQSSDLVFQGDDGTLWAAQYDTTNFTGFTFEEIASIDGLLAGGGVVGGSTSVWAVAGLGLLGAGGAAAAASGGGGGGGSGGGSGDTTAPLAPTDLLISPDGLLLSGRGEPGTSVTVRDASGNVLGTAITASDGRFEVPLATPQRNGESLEVTLTDEAGNASPPGNIIATDSTPPQAPGDLAIDDRGSILTGRAEPGSTIQVRGAGGVLLGSAVADAEGRFSVTLDPPQTEGQVLQLTATDAAGNSSATTGITAPTIDVPPGDTTPPDAPANLLVSSDGLRLTGSGEVGASVIVRHSNGSIAGSGTVGADGRFEITLDGPQLNGESLAVTLTDAAGNVSQPASVLAPDSTDPAAPRDLTIDSQGTTLSGNAEPFSTIQVRGPGGTLLGTATTAADGRFSVTLTPPQTDGQLLQLTATDAAGNTSPDASITAPDIDVPPGDTTPPAAPINLAFSGDGSQVSGWGEPGATVRIIDGQGNLLASAVLDGSGIFLFTLSPPIADGRTLQVTLTDPAGNVSANSPLVSPDLISPIPPTNLQLNGGQTLTGQAEAGTRIQVRDANGNLIGSAVVGSNGQFSVTLNPPQANGESLDIRIVDASGNQSMPLILTAPDTTLPALLSNVVIGADGLSVSGQGEAGAQVRIYDANNNLIGSATVTSNGSFSLTLNTPVAPNDTVRLVQVDAAGNSSPALLVLAPDADGPSKPVNLVTNASGSQLTGSADATNLIEVRGPNGQLLGSTTVGSNGSFTVNLSPPAANGEVLNVVAIDGNNESSVISQITAPDITPPSAPTQLVVSADGLTVSGRGEAGATVQVRDGQGNLLGSGLVGATGSFSVGLSSAQIDGEQLQVALIDPATNTSTPVTVTAPNVDGALLPSLLNLNTSGNQLSGFGQAGSTVVVKAADGTTLGSAIVGADGHFVVNLSSPQRNGQSLSVEASDDLGNSAGPVGLVAPDTQPPSPVSGVLIDSSGLVVSGQGEVGATVRVLDANGNILGSTTVPNGGNFQITLSSAQTNAEALTVVQRDGSGNISTAVAITAPDDQDPAAPGNLVLSADGAQLSGTGEAGATVEVRNTNGTLIGSTTVGDDGYFSAQLVPPQLNGQSLVASQIDATGNSSPTTPITATDLQPPAAPSGLSLSPDGLVLNGTGEAGATVEVRDINGNLLGSDTVGSSGQFSISLTPAQVDGQTLSVSQIDTAGHASSSTNVTADDGTPPGAPGNLSVSNNGGTLSGTGEAGATVEVHDGDDNLLGSGQVDSNGNFSVSLTPPQRDGQSLTVSQIDAAGNGSASTSSIIAPDITPPSAPGNLVINPAGNAISGSAEVGSTVVVKDAQGNALGQETVGNGGTFSIPLVPPLTNGEKVTVVVADANGNSNTPVSLDAPDATPPAAPTNLVISPDGSSVSGNAEPGATVIVRDSNGNDLGSATAGSDGVFVIQLPTPVSSGETVQVVAEDSKGNISNGSPLNGPDGSEVDTPGALSLDANGINLTGNGTPGSQIDVYDVNGNSLGSATVGSGGSFLVLLNPAQLNGQTLHVVASDPLSGNASVPATLVAADTSAPNAPDSLVIAANGSTLSGHGEIGATVRVVGPGNVLLGTTTVGSNGLFSVNLSPAQLNAQSLTVTQSDASGNTSAPATATAPDLQAPSVATGLTLNAAATVVSGNGEAGATVTVRDAGGSILATGTVNQSGAFQVTLPSAQATGAPLQVTLTDTAGNASSPASLATPDRTPPPAVSGLSVSPDGSQMSGTGEVGATVQVRDSNGTLLGSATVASNGHFTLSLSPAANAGQSLEISQLDNAGNRSPATTLAAPDLTAPTPLTNLVLNNNGLTLTGQGEAGATVTVRALDGSSLGTTVVTSDGSFSLTLFSAQLNAQHLTVTQADSAGNASLPSTVIAPDFTPPPAPSALLLASTGLQLSGQAEAGSTVTVRDALGQILGSATAAANGNFQITLSSPQLNGQSLQVRATDAAGNSSPATPYIAADLTAPLVVSDLAVAPTGNTLTGHGEAGATVEVRDINGNLLGSDIVGSTGSFTVNLLPAAIAGQNLSVVQSDAAGNASPPQLVVAPGPLVPDTPSGLLLSADGLMLTGNSSPGTTVKVYGPGGELLGSAQVTLNGSFSVPLANPQTNGQVLQVSAVGLDGTPSLPAQIQAADTSAPQPLTQLALSPDGATLSGRGEAGATVTVLGEGGLELGSAVVNGDGTFSVSLAPPQLDGDLLSASQADAAGNESNSVTLTAPDLVAPNAPTGLSLSSDGLVLSGSGEAGTLVSIRAADGTLLGSGTVRVDGGFQVTLNSAQTNGQTLRVQLTDNAGNQSTSTQLQASDTSPPSAVSDLAIAGDGATLTGRGEPGATVAVRDSDGNLLGSATVGSTGSFSLVLNPPLGNAEVLQFIQTDVAGNASPIANLTTPDFTPPDPLTGVLINAAGALVTGFGEAGAAVTVRDANGTLLGTGTVLPDGSFSVALNPPQINKQQLTVQQADPPGNVSDPTLITAPDLIPPDAPTNLQLNAAGDQLGGSGEIGTQVRVTLIDGTLLGTGTVLANGTFLVSLAPPQLNGQQLLVTLQDASSNTSAIASLTAADTTPPATPTALQIDATGTLLSGTGEAGSRLVVLNATGDTVGTGQIGTDGTFVVTLSTPQQNGGTLRVIAQDTTGNPSPAATIGAPDLIAPAAPTVTSLTLGGTLLTGTAEADAFITVRGPDNGVLGTGQTNAQGIYSITLLSAQTNGELLSVVARDAANNSSPVRTFTAGDSTPPDPVSNLSINAGYDQLAGRGEAGATVSVSQGGLVLGTAVVAANGTFMVALNPPAGANVQLDVIQTDTALNPSTSLPFTTPQIPVPATPTDLALAGDGLTLTGAAAIGSAIRVYAANGNLIGQGTAGNDGRFTLTLDSPQTNGQTLGVTASLVSGESLPASITAADTTPPAAPDGLLLSGNGLTLSGTGEAGATVEVRNAGGTLLGTAQVGGSGVFSVSLSGAQLNGQVLSVRQTDTAGNHSTNSSLTAADVQAPVAPTNLAVNANGSTLTGNGEAGATINVYNATGDLVGTGTVLGNGLFSVALSPAQADGQLLTVRQSDAANNTSGNASVTAPDITAPTAPAQVAINASGSQITGTGQAGTTVTVRNSGGTVLGSALVAANGTFVVTLSAPQINSQALSVTLTDGASNTSTATGITAPDLTPPPAASALLVDGTGLVLTGSGEVGATVTVKSAGGTVLGSGTVAGNGVFTVNLSSPQINGEVLTVTLTDNRGNVSPTATVTAPDIDANTPVIASDNLATATVILAPVVSSKSFNDSFTTLLSGFTKIFTFTVASGNTVDPTLTLTTSSAVALLDGAVFSLQVKNASGAWVTLASGSSAGLLDLILLPLGQGLRVDIGVLQAGEYRLMVASTGIGVLTTVTTRLDIETTSLASVNASPGAAITGNVITDIGTDGTRDVTGPDNSAQLLILKNGSYVPTNGGVTVHGLYGTLTIDANGNYSYTPNGSASSVGKVDVFSYELRHPNGLSDTANLYVRIDSPQAAEIWNDSNLPAPARVVDAINDIDDTSITLVNRETTSSATLGSFNVPLIGSNSGTYTISVAANTVSDLQVVIVSSNLLGLLNGITLSLYKLNTTNGQYELVKSLAGGALISLLGGAYGTTFEDQTAGTYQIRVASGGIGLLASITTSLNTTTTYNNQFVVGSYTPVTGNLLTDTAGGGADVLGSPYTLLSVLVAGSYLLPGYNGVSVAGTYGTLLVHANGSYTYTLNPGLSDAVIGKQDVFTYQLTHPNGTSDTATLTIDLKQSGAFSSLMLSDSADASDSMLLAGASSDDVIHGSDGDDRLDGSQGGPLTLRGGSGDDTLVIADQQFTEIDGGAGHDTLLWAGGDASIDLGQLVGRLHDIEVIDLNDTSAVTLTLSLADVLAVTGSASDTLMIKGDSQDQVNLTDTWNAAGTANADGVDYTHYIAQEDPSHHLWVQSGIHVV